MGVENRKNGVLAAIKQILDAVAVQCLFWSVDRLEGVCTLRSACYPAPPHNPAMSVASRASTNHEKQDRDLRNNRRRSLMTLFTNSSVPLRRGSVQGALKFGLVDIDTDSPDVDQLSFSSARHSVDGGITGSIPEDIIREIAALLPIADILNFSLTVRSASPLIDSH